MPASEFMVPASDADPDDLYVATSTLADLLANVQFVDIV